MLVPLAEVQRLSILINFIANNYFTDCLTTCFIESGQRHGSLELESNHIPKILIFKSPFSREGEELEFHIAIENGINLGCKCWILQESTAQPFMDIYENITTTTAEQRPIRPKFLIYRYQGNSSTNNRHHQPEQDDEDQKKTNYQNISALLNHPLMRNVPDVLFILPSSAVPSRSLSSAKEVEGAFDFDLLTSKFVGRLNNSAPVLIESARINSNARGGDAPAAAASYDDDDNRITFKFGHREPLYNRRKVFNLQGRHLALAAFYYRPYTTVTDVAPGKGNANSGELYLETVAERNGASGAEFPERTKLLDGIEGNVMLETCKKFNCTLLMVEDDGYEWGEVYDNHTGNGILGHVVQKRAEVAVGSLYIWYHEYLFMEFSMPISRSGITSLVPKPKLLKSTLIALMPFSFQVWMAMLISFCVVSLVNFLVEKIQLKLYPEISSHPSLVDSSFFVYGILLEQSIDHRSLLFAKGILTSLVLLQGFVMGSAFAGSLLSFLAVPRYEPPIDTPADLAESNVHWSATHIAWIYSILDSDNPVTMTVRDHFEVRPRNDLERVNYEGTLGYAIEQLEYGYFAFADYIAPHTLEKMRPMREDIIYGPVAAAIVRSWYLKDEFDDLILRIGQSGIQSYWLLDITYRQLDPAVQMAMKVSNVHHLEKATVAEQLRLDGMVGIFYMLILGLTLALLVFVLEIVYAKYFGQFLQFVN